MIVWEKIKLKIESEQECYVCKGKYKLTLDFTVDYSTKVIGERLTK